MGAPVAEGRSIGRSLFSLVLLAATALGLYNVYGATTEVAAKAGLAACGGVECPYTISQGSRNPLFHSYMLTVTPPGKTRRTADVECKRALYLLGDYECVVTSR